MSTFKVEVVPFELEKHSNADSLSIAKIKGWQCVVKTSDFEGVKLGAYIPIDAELPEKPEWEFMRPRKFRVKTIKLRGALSQGLLIPAKSKWQEGQDVTEELGVKKWEPHEQVRLGGDAIPQPEEFHKYTGVENWKNYPDVIKEGEQVIITEKLHGTNARFGIINGQFYCGSHRLARKLVPSEIKSWWQKIYEWLIPPQPFTPSIYAKVAHQLDMKKRIESLGYKNDNIIVFGEIYGGGVQKGFKYGHQEPSFRVFDISVNGEYVSHGEVVNYTARMELEMVPILKGGAFSKEDLKLADGQSTVENAGHIREGIVIKPITERQEHMGRVILKYVSDDYLLKEKDDEEAPQH